MMGIAQAIPSEPPSLAHPTGRATRHRRGGVHPLGEPALTAARRHVLAEIRRQ
jgi:hypothetical protein